MKIRIFERCNPFSHNPGISCLVPGTKQIVTAYPAKINDEILDVKGPIKEWTLFQNLEHGKIQIRGIAQNEVFTREMAGPVPFEWTKLTFGVHKAQRMECIKERCAPEEFLPFWFALGQYYDFYHDHPQQDSMLSDLATIDRQHLYQAWKHLFQAGFSDWFVPRLKDSDFHGFSKDPVSGDDPFVLLSQGARHIGEMLVQSDGSHIKILPKLPPELHCGRVLHLEVKGVGIISLEWSKKEIKKIILYPTVSKEIVLIHPKRVQSFRVATKCCTSRQTIEKPLKIEKDEVIFFDQFQH